METKREFTVQILSVTDWETDDNEFAATASHEGDDATLDIQLEERKEKTGSEAWNDANLKQKTVTFRKTLDRDAENDEMGAPVDKTAFDEIAEVYREKLEEAAVEHLRNGVCAYDLLKPLGVEIRIAMIDGRFDSVLAAEKKTRDVLLYCMNVIMRHLNNEEAQEPWLVNGIPDGTAVEEPGEELVREIAESDITTDDFESMLRTFVRTLATEVFPDVEFGDRHETMALY